MPLDTESLDLTDEVVRTARLLLRPWTTGDVDHVTRAYQDEQMARWIPAPLPYTRDDAVAWVERTVGDRAEGRALFTAVEAEGSFVGSAGLQFSAPLLGPMVGYWTAPWARGLGYAAEAAAALTEWAFARGAHRLHLFADVANLPSQVVARRAGFREEGLVRACLPYRDRPHGDAVLFSRLPGDPAPG